MYLLIWWVVLFAVLPVGTRPEPEPDVNSGWRGAPVRPRMGRKILATTLITALIWGGCVALIESVNDGVRRGLRLTFEDHGPGIPDVGLAMKDGYTTAGGLGLGLSGAKRLSNEFSIDSAPGRGTRVVITRWK